jgi:large subunit ribosomal protein L5
MLKEKFNKEIKDKLKAELGLKNDLAVPKPLKVVVNVGLKEALVNDKVLDEAEKNIAAITGQKPVVRRAKKAIAGFNLRAGQPIGISVTLRGDKMWSFIERLTSTALPRVRDFRGLPDSFDGHGNYSLGLREHTVFPEVDLGRASKTHGVEVTIRTNANSDEGAKKLLTALGLPIRGENRG